MIPNPEKSQETLNLKICIGLAYLVVLSGFVLMGFVIP
jgi:hypothetical protein